MRGMDTLGMDTLGMDTLEEAPVGVALESCGGWRMNRAFARLAERCGGVEVLLGGAVRAEHAIGLWRAPGNDLVLAFDLADERRLDAERRGALRRLSAITDGAEDAVIEIEGERVTVSARFWEMLGYAPGDAASGTRCELGDVADALLDPGSFRAALDVAPGAPVLWTGAARRAGGGSVWLSLRGRHLGVSVAGVISDVTERVETEERLRAARDEAEQASRAKSAFLATMSHEIRTPMNTIIAALDLMGGSPDPEQASLLRMAREAAGGLMDILNDILDLSKIEAGKLELDVTEVPLAAFLRRVADGHRRQAEAKGVTFEIQLHASLPPAVSGDPMRLRQIVGNLLANAVKFTDAGHVTLAARWDDGLSVEVADSGIGIRDEHLARLFQPFTQADGSITRRYGGTGLGLSICSRLVEAMGGRLEVASRVGEGSRFTVRLPLPAVERHSADLGGRTVLLLSGNAGLLAEAGERLSRCGAEVQRCADARSALTAAARTTPDLILADERTPGYEAACPALGLLAPGVPVLPMAAAADPARLERALASGVPAPAPLGRVLVVEDTEHAREVLLRQLRALGVPGEAVGDGVEALARLDGAEPVLLLSDLHMPRLDGHGLLTALRARRPGLPVIAVTADVLSQSRPALLQEGFDDVVTKPATLDDLARTVLPWLRGERSRINAAERLPVDAALHERIFGPVDAATRRRHQEILDRNVRRDLERLRAAMRDGGDQAGAAHTLKGTAAMGAALPLQEAAAALEAALREDGDGAPALAAVEDRARELLGWINQQTEAGLLQQTQGLDGHPGALSPSAPHPAAASPPCSATRP